MMNNVVFLDDKGALPSSIFIENETVFLNSTKDPAHHYTVARMEAMSMSGYCLKSRS
jgi:hypothetical protein